MLVVDSGAFEAIQVNLAGTWNQGSGSHRAVSTLIDPALQQERTPYSPEFS